jgi:hypothetical protein
MTSSALLRCSALLKLSKLMTSPALLTCSALGSAPKFTFAQALDEGEILIRLISTIYTGLDEKKGDERHLSSELGER